MSQILPLNVEILWKEGIPKDTLIVRIPHSPLWVEFKHWANGNYRVCLGDPNKGVKALVAQSASFKTCKALMDLALIPHKEPKDKVETLKWAKSIIKNPNKNSKKHGKSSF